MLPPVLLLNSSHHTRVDLNTLTGDPDLRTVRLWVGHLFSELSFFPLQNIYNYSTNIPCYLVN